MSDGCATQPAECRSQFEHIIDKLDRLDVSIRGNGKPGIERRLDRLERAEATRTRLMWLVVGSVVTLLVGTIARWVG